MSADNVIQSKSYSFALKTVFLSRLLVSKGEYVLSKQLLRSGTSIGANIEEAQAAQTRKEFHSKMPIAFKEALETRYWLRLLRDSKTLEMNYAEHLKGIEEPIKILAAITKNTKAT